MQFQYDMKLKGKCSSLLWYLFVSMISTEQSTQFPLRVCCACTHMYFVHAENSFLEVTLIWRAKQRQMAGVFKQASIYVDLVRSLFTSR